MLPCVCRLMVEQPANRSAGHPLAGSSERRPAEEKHCTLQQTQAGPQAPHTQAQIQVQSLLYVFAPTVLVVPLLPGGTCLLPPDLYRFNSGCLQLHHLCMVQCIGGLQCQCLLPDARDRCVLVKSCRLASFRQIMYVSNIHLCIECFHTLTSMLML